MPELRARSESGVAVGRWGRIVDGVGSCGALGLAAVWVVVLARIASHRIFVTTDSLSNYAHVSFISDRLWHHHQLPFRMPTVGAGRAFAFPYALVPWLLTALVWPLGGDRTVTAALIIGSVGTVAATFWAFPELRRSWWAAAVLLNPALVSAPLLGQLPFTWAAALLLAAVACWRRGRWWSATVLAALAQVTHVAIVAPLVAGLVAVRLLSEVDRRRLLRHYAVSVVPALPAAWLVARSPVFVDSSTSVKAANFVTTLAPRSLVLILPALLVAACRRVRFSLVGPLIVAALIALNVAAWKPLRLPFAWRGLDTTADTAMESYTKSPNFDPLATYRVLRVADGKVAMYQLLQAGGRLDSEFFPESIMLRDWPNAAAYSAFLRSRDVDDVMVWRSYVIRSRFNEYTLLDRMAHDPPPTCDGPLVCVRAATTSHTYTVFAITRAGPAPP